MPTRIEVNLQTGTVTELKLEGAELAAYNASLAAQAAMITPAPEPETPATPQMPSPDSVTFETIELDASKENLLLKVACGLVGAPVLASVDDAYGNCQQFEGVLDETGRFSFSASLSNINDGPLQLVALINYGELQTELTFELSRGV